MRGQRWRKNYACKILRFIIQIFYENLLSQLTNIKQIGIIYIYIRITYYKIFNVILLICKMSISFINYHIIH
jgi:hypothetical protein